MYSISYLVAASSTSESRITGYVTESGDESVTALNTESLTRLEPLIQERIEDLNSVEFMEELDFALLGQFGPGDLVALVHEPDLLLLVDDVHILEADLATIDDAQHRLQLPEGPLFPFEDETLQPSSDLRVLRETERHIEGA